MSEALPERTRDETDVGWGDWTPPGPDSEDASDWGGAGEPADDLGRLTAERPPHHDRA